MSQDFKQIALVAAAKGFCVFPCVPGQKEPLTDHGFYDATTNAEQIAAWWQRWPRANVAVRTGRESGIFVLDPDGLEGVKSWAALEAKHGALPKTRTHKTGDGRHLIFKYPEVQGIEIKSAGSALGPRLDVKGDGGYVVWAGSIHPSGALYEIEIDAPPAEAPDWLIELVKKNGDALPSIESAGPELGELNLPIAVKELIKRGVEKGQRSEAVMAVIVSMIRAGAADDVILRTFEDNPGGIGEKCFEKRGGRVKWLLEEIRKGRAFAASSSPPARQPADPEPPPAALPWPTASAAMFYGWMGNHAREATEQTEADPVATFFTGLAFFGAEVGRNAWINIGDDTHHTRLFFALVGNTSRGRKGTSAGPILRLFKNEDGGSHAFSRLSYGPLSSGEGLVHAVRDPRYDFDRKKQEQILVDPGVDDKRLLVLESEMAAGISCMRRDGNTLSMLLRCFFDGVPAEPLTKSNPTRSTGHHVCLVAHITNHELIKILPEAENFTGYSNRFLWACVRRPQLVPFPSRMPTEAVRKYRKTLLDCLAFASKAGEITLSAGAREVWLEVYPQLSKDTPGLIGAVTSRSEAYTLRLALIFALSDCSKLIEPKHLQAALKVWGYCEASARYIFSGAAEDVIQAKILEALADGPKTATELYKGAFQSHTDAAKIRAALDELKRSGRVIDQAEKTAGRPKVTYELKIRRPDGDEVLI